MLGSMKVAYRFIYEVFFLMHNQSCMGSSCGLNVEMCCVFTNALDLKSTVTFADLRVGVEHCVDLIAETPDMHLVETQDM